MIVRSILFGATGMVAVLSAPVMAWAEVGAGEVGAPNQLEEIVVTGEKASRSLQDTVASVAVVGARQIEQENLQGLFDVVDRTANVSQTYGPSGFTIRGISNTNVSGGGSGGLASVYVDGAAIPERHLNATPLDMWDVAQVEVLRGPQSTLQGRNALAGAIVIRTQDPTFEWTGRARAIVTDADDRTFSIAGGGPIVADQLAVRLSVEDRKADGFIYNTTRRENENPLDSTTVRAKVLITPSALPGLRLRTVWTHDERDGGYIFTYARTDVPDAFDKRVSEDDSPNASKGKTDVLGLEADYDLSERLTLTAVTAYTRSKTLQSYDGDGTALNLSYGVQDELDRTISQEVRLNYDGARLSGLLGGYFARRERDYTLASRTNVPTPASTLIGVLTGPPFGLDAATAQLAAGLYVQALPVIPVDYAAVTGETVTTAALFGDMRFQLTDRLSLLAGFRYDRETNDQANVQTADFVGAYPDPALYGAFAPVIGGLNQVVGLFVAQASASAPPAKRTFEAFLPKAGLKYDVTDDVALSVVVQRGYRSGGSSINIARSTVVAYDPEYTWNYEAALRSAWLDGALTVNANAYYVTWRDQQVSVNLGLNLYDYQTANAGRSHLYGFEVEARHRPSSNLEVYASLGHSRTEFDEFQVAVGTTDIDLTGSEFAYAPHWTWAVGANYRWDNGFAVNVNANRRSAAFGATGVNQAIYAIKGRTLVNARVSYAHGPWEAAVFARNLFDQAYTQYQITSTQRALFGDPRVIGASLEARW
ncbi:TonB-dependent receptor [Phenylobacterium sp.]|uniref:TonB-dependent receptor n=1 Tax=Phenylobacterium sp. TaxID=1871053 RepID=UPI00301B9EDA